MKRTISRRRKLLKPPIAWQEAEYAKLQFNAADTCDDRVSDNIYDFEDERAEIEEIAHRMFDNEN